MSAANVAGGTEPATIYCPHCGQAMRVRAEHLGTPVACPGCQRALDPVRIAAAHGRAGAAMAPPPAYGYGPHAPAGYSWRNRWVAGALGVLLGALGVHRFYLGFKGIGFAQIVVSILTLGVVGSIWGFIEGILCFCGAMRDVDGLPLSG